jgi:hypothetical protein
MTDRSYLDSDRSESSDGWMDGWIRIGDHSSKSSSALFSVFFAQGGKQKTLGSPRQVAVWVKLVLSLLAFQGSHANWGCLLNNVYVYIYIYIMSVLSTDIKLYQILSYLDLHIYLYNYFKSIQMINVVPSPHSDFGLRKTKAREGGGGDHHR